MVMKNVTKCDVTQHVTLGIVGRETVLAHLLVHKGRPDLDVNGD